MSLAFRVYIAACDVSPPQSEPRLGHNPNPEYLVALDALVPRPSNGLGSALLVSSPRFKHLTV